jgi:hypothetical protein
MNGEATLGFHQLAARQRRLRIVVLLAAILTLGLIGVNSSRAAPPKHTAGGIEALIGSVRDPAGQPIHGAMVQLAIAGAPAPVVKVFTDERGSFRVPRELLGPNTYVNSIRVDVKKLGYSLQQPPSSKLTDLHPAIRDASIEVNLVMAPLGNVAAQVPSSAWLNLLPDTEERWQLIKSCTQCHQFPNVAVRRTAAALVPLAEEHRTAAWHAVIHPSALPPRHPLRRDLRPQRRLLRPRTRATSARATRMLSRPGLRQISLRNSINTP